MTQSSARNAEQNNMDSYVEHVTGSRDYAEITTLLVNGVSIARSLLGKFVPQENRA